MAWRLWQMSCTDSFMPGEMKKMNGMLYFLWTTELSSWWWVRHRKECLVGSRVQYGWIFTGHNPFVPCFSWFLLSKDGLHGLPPTHTLPLRQDTKKNPILITQFLSFSTAGAALFSDFFFLEQLPWWQFTMLSLLFSQFPLITLSNSKWLGTFQVSANKCFW